MSHESAALALFRIRPASGRSSLARAMTASVLKYRVSSGTLIAMGWKNGSSIGWVANKRLMVREKGRPVLLPAGK